MIIKSSNLMYVINFDSTLVTGDLSGFERSHSGIFGSKLLFNPDEYDIRWTILTSRPKIDVPLIRLKCLHCRINPSQIITNGFYFKRFKKLETIFNFKINKLKSILERKTGVKYTKFSVSKIIYISNNVDEIKYMNANSDMYPILSMTVADFYTQIFVNTI